MMKNKRRGKYYQIVVKGHLDAKWSEWFNDMTIQNMPDGDAVLSGIVVDQAALHGLLIKIRDLGLVLISVRSLEDENGRQVYEIG
jgi:hypothetical protein